MSDELQQLIQMLRAAWTDPRPLYRCPWCQWSGTEPGTDQDGTRRCPCCDTQVYVTKEN